MSGTAQAGMPHERGQAKSHHSPGSTVTNQGAVPQHLTAAELEKGLQHRSDWSI